MEMETHVEKVQASYSEGKEEGGIVYLDQTN